MGGASALLGEAESLAGRSTIGPAGTGAGWDGRGTQDDGRQRRRHCGGQQALELAAGLGDSALQVQASQRLGEAYYASSDFEPVG